MSLDLRLLPIDSMNGGTCGHGFSHTILNAPAPREYADAIQALAVPISGHKIHSFVGARVPDGKMKGEHVYGLLVKDAYGDRYTWITAGELGSILALHHPTHPTTAYINALPPGTYVVLDWH